MENFNDSEFPHDVNSLSLNFLHKFKFNKIYYSLCFFFFFKKKALYYIS